MLRRPQARATIVDIARKLGISAITVSRALNGSAESILSSPRWTGPAWTWDGGGGTADGGHRPPRGRGGCRALRPRLLSRQSTAEPKSPPPSGDAKKAVASANRP
jgi:hypothetical protein